MMSTELAYFRDAFLGCQVQMSEIQRQDKISAEGLGQEFNGVIMKGKM